MKLNFASRNSFRTSDGTAAGTKLSYQFSPGNSPGFSIPGTIFTDGTRLYMGAGDSNNQQLWVGDGTPDGTYEIAINAVADSHPTNFLPNITIYPNPAHDKLYVDMPTSSNYQISIIDMLGRTLMTTKNASQGIDISQLPAALYALIITDTENTTIGSAHFFKK